MTSFRQPPTMRWFSATYRDDTSSMLSRILVALLSLLALTPAVRAQVRVSVPRGNHHIEEKVTATVMNGSRGPITICVESGQISTTKDPQVSTQVPFTIESQSPQGWKVLMVRASGSRSAVVLESKKSLEYPFWPPSHGELRLRMRYWEGARPDMDCARPPKDSRKAKPAVFEVPFVLM